MRPERTRRAAGRGSSIRRAVGLAAAAVIGSASGVAASPEPGGGAPAAVAPATVPSTEGSVLAAPDNPFDLTEEQRTRIGEIVMESGVHAGRLKRDLAEARADLKQSLEAPEPDFDEVMRGVERVGQLEIDLRKHQIATLMSLRALLTEDQREVLTRFLRAATEREQQRAAARAMEPGGEPGATAPDHVTSEIPGAMEAAASR